MVIPLQDCSYDISLRFTIRDVNSYFDNPDLSIVTEEFASGWYFKLNSSSTDGKGDKLSLRLTPPCSRFRESTVHWSGSVTSLSGVETYSHFLVEHTYQENTGYGTCVLRKRHVNSEIFRKENAVVVYVTLRTPSHPSPRSDLPSRLIHHALKKSEADEGEMDICFNTFSHRTRSGTLTQPTLLFASQKYLKQQCNCLYSVFEGEDDLWKLHKDGRTMGISTTEDKTIKSQLDEDSDFGHSDTDDDEDSGSDTLMNNPDEDLVSEQKTTTPNPIVLKVENPMEVDASNGDDQCRNSDPSGGNKDVDCEPEGVASEISKLSVAGIVVSDFARPTFVHSSPLLSKEVERFRRVEAFLHYLYTGEIVFAPLSSEPDGARWKFIEKFQKSHRGKPRPCSCKSIYQLAYELELKPLQSYALQHLEWQLNNDNIVEEIFSFYTSRHQEARKLEMDYLMTHWDQIQSGKAFQHKLEEVAHGDYPHCGKIMSEIFSRVAKIPRGPGSEQ